MITASTIDASDPAAVFGAALSLWTAWRRIDGRPDGINLSQTYEGMDSFMRVVMKVASLFEEWACKHIDFDQNMDVWPYRLEDDFGEACLAEMLEESLDHFDEDDCLRVAIRLQLPIKLATGLPVPVDVRVTNTVPGSTFREYRIQTVRLRGDLDSVEPFVVGDDPYDDNYGKPYFGVYGADEKDILEHVADRDNYDDAVALVQKLAPNVEFPSFPRAKTVPFIRPKNL